MKIKIFILCCIILNSLSLLSQTSGWIWANKAIGNYSESGESIAADSYGNVYVTGRFNSNTIIFGDTILINNSPEDDDIFIAKYDADGNVIWAKNIGGNSDDGGKGIAVDDNGNLFITGFYHSSTISFDSIVLTTVNYSIFLAKADTAGNFIWVKSAGYGNVASDCVAIDYNGNAYITGIFLNPVIIFDSITLIGSPGDVGDVFVAKYDPSGNVLWAKSAGGISYDRGYSIAVDLNGNSYAVGYFSSISITFGNFILFNSETTGNGYDGFIVKYDSSGNVLWAKKAGDYDIVYGNAIDPNGNLYITGGYGKSLIVFDNDSLINTTGATQLFLVKYDASGNVAWARSSDGVGSVLPQNIKSDINGNTYIAGFFGGPEIYFDSITLKQSPLGYSDVFAVKYDIDGNVLWAERGGGNSWDYGYGVAVDGNENCYVTGSFKSEKINFGNIYITNSKAINQTTDIFVAKVGKSIGINEENYTNDFLNIFPNPSCGQIEITSNNIIKELIIRNLIGQIVYHKITTNENFSFQFINDGVYFITIKMNNKEITKKVVILH